MPKRGKVLHKEDRKNSVGRLLFVILAVIVQIIWCWCFLYYLTESYLWASIFGNAFVFFGIRLRLYKNHAEENRSGGCHALPLSGSVSFDFRSAEKRK